MVQILQDKEAKEIYVTNGEISNSKYVLIIFKNGSVALKWCLNDTMEEQVNPLIEKVGRRMMVEYGEPNLFDIRPKLPFTDEQGNLDKRWEKFL